MRIGVPKEIKNHEYRVGLVPSSVRELRHHGHDIFIEKDTGLGIGVSNEDYERSGAIILPDAASIFETAEMIVKVKEPQPQECALLREDHILFAYLHLAPDPEQAKNLMHAKCVAIAYETVTDNTGGLPLLSPMSEVAGRMSIHVGATALEKFNGGSGVLLGGVPGVKPSHVLVLGGGVVGTNAARMAMGLEAHVTIIDKSLTRLRQLDTQFGSSLDTIYATVEAIEYYSEKADLIIGAVLLPGAAAPKLISKTMLKKMRPGSVIVDVAIDQGGCFETSHPTTHDSPTYVVDDIIHYCVTNMPGAVARTSSFAFNNATLPFVVALADKGYKKALQEDPHLLNGLNVAHGHITHEAVARALGEVYTPAFEAL